MVFNWLLGTQFLGSVKGWCLELDGVHLYNYMIYTHIYIYKCIYIYILNWGYLKTSQASCGDFLFVSSLRVGWSPEASSLELKMFGSNDESECVKITTNCLAGSQLLWSFIIRTKQLGMYLRCGFAERRLSLVFSSLKKGSGYSGLWHFPLCNLKIQSWGIRYIVIFLSLIVGTHFNRMTLPHRDYTRFRLTAD